VPSNNGTPPEVRVVAVGIVQVTSDIELRFHREPWGWRPDLVVNMKTQEVSQPPECFKPTHQVIAALDAAWEALRSEPVPAPDLDSSEGFGYWPGEDDRPRRRSGRRHN
jgi:hypothetical protein